MKKISFFVLLFSSAIILQAEENSFSIESVSLSSGEGALSSGLFFEAVFSKNKDLFGIYLGERDICVYYLKPLFNQKVYLGPSWEYYFNTPTFGAMLLSTPYLSKNENFSLSTFTWTGVSAGTPLDNVDLLNWRFLFFFNQINLNYKNLSLSTSLMWYEEWGHLFEIKYSREIIRKLEIFTSAGYSWYQDEKYLFKFGLKYEFNK